MRKLLFIILACLLICGQAFAGTGIASSDNVRIIRSPIGAPTPFVESILVNVGSSDAIAIGDVLVWNTDVSNGFSVLKATTNSDSIAAANPMPIFAGVALEVTSADTSSANANSTKSGNTSAVHMAIRGFCQAKIDASAAVKGHPLVIRGGDLTASFGTLQIGVDSFVSQDIGVLLDDDEGVDGPYNVWLR